MSKTAPTVIIFKDEHGLREVEVVEEKLIDKKTKEALTAVRCEVNFKPAHRDDMRGFTLYGCRLTELFKDEDGETTGFSVDYDKKVYFDEEE